MIDFKKIIFKMLKNRSRFTIPQLIEAIKAKELDVNDQMYIEEQARDQLDDSLYYLSEANDYFKHKARYHIKGDQAYHQQMFHKRLRLQKELNLLNERLNKLYVIYKIGHIEKIMLINEVLKVDMDCRNAIKHIIYSYFCKVYYKYY